MKDLKGLKINCDNDKEKRELLEEATKQGFTWMSCGKKPLVYENALRTNGYGFHVDKKMSCYESDCISYKEYKAMSEFTKADLKPCMVVVRRNGEVCGVSENQLGMFLQNARGTCFCQISDYGNDLIKSKDDYELDIMQVYGLARLNNAISVENRPLLWERKEEPQVEEMTLSEVCKALGKNIKIVKE